MNYSTIMLQQFSKSSLSVLLRKNRKMVMNSLSPSLEVLLRMPWSISLFGIKKFLRNILELWSISKVSGSKCSLIIPLSWSAQSSQN